MRNIFKKIITESFPNLEKDIPIQMQEASSTPNRPDQNRTTPRHIIIKTTSSETRERILKAIREKKQVTHKGKPIEITADFSTETLKAKECGVRSSGHRMKITSTPEYSTQQNYHSK
jgi:hypothetical protein